MSDQRGGPSARQPGDVPIKAGRKSFFDRASLIWAIPIIAFVVALGAAWRSYSEQGPLIEVSFSQAAGIRANETQLRYRDIQVGLVEEVTFSEDLQTVIASIRIDSDLAPYVDADARFWVVRPEVTAQGVTGLDTVLSGAYLQGAWDNQPGGLQNTFVGLESTPLLATGRDGTVFTLRSAEQLPAAGTPIVYKGINVGAVGDTRISPDGTGVLAEAVVYDPYNQFVTTSTRFWDISGFSFSLGAAGARLNFTSLASLISGGVTFETIGSGGEALSEASVFNLFPDEDQARDDLLVAGNSATVDFAMVFDQNIAGLSQGAAVELGGLRVGDVTSINGLLDPVRFGDNDVRLIVTVRINPARMGVASDAGGAALLDYLDTRIAEGLRARMVNASLFTGGLKIQLVDVPNAEPATLDRAADPLPTIPTAPADVADVGATAQGALQRVSDLPIEELMQSITGFLDNASTLIGNDDLQNAPAELRGLLAAVRIVAESEGVQNLPAQTGAMLDELRNATETLNRVVVEFEAGDLVGRLTSAIDDVATAAEDLPQLVAQARTILTNAGEVPLEELTQQATNLLDAANRLVDQDSTRQLPDELNQALAAVRGTLNELQEGDLVGNANETMASARDAARAIATASESLPQIAEDLRNVARQAGSTLSAYGEDSQFTRDAQGAIREIEAAASAVESLARMLERNPNSLILGR